MLAAAPALPAQAKSYWIAAADVTVAVESDGSLHVTELLTFDFSGGFSGTYRDIPLGPGQSIEGLTVGDESGPYAPGGCAEPGCDTRPGAYGVERRPGLVRVVWGHDSRDERRTFELEYVWSGAAVAYDDVVDVNIKVWGDQWPVGLDRLTAQVTIPEGAAEGDVLVWGRPRGVAGSVSLGDDGVSPSLTAREIPAEQWVELRVVFPAQLLSGAGGATVVAGDGLDLIKAEETQSAEDAESAAGAVRAGWIVGAVLLAVIVGGLGGLIYFLYGREPKVAYDREYEQAPPSDLSPAEVGALLSQGGVAEREFTATLFDLIRKGAIDAVPSQVERSTWGGLKSETITDLVLSLGSGGDDLAEHEESVMTVVRRVLAPGPRPLHELRSGIREDASANASTYRAFRSEVVSAVRGAGFLDERGAAAAVVVAVGLIAAGVAAFLIMNATLRGRPGGTAAVFLIVAGMGVGAVLLLVLLAFRRVRVKRSPAGAMEAERWGAFRRYLADFSNLEEAPVISLDLWDRFLVYAIVFGVASEVLERARLDAPPELERTSSIYWFGGYGFSGGHTENAFAGLNSALSGAFAPPSSGSGGGFSVGGGAGAGGGGGGAW